MNNEIPKNERTEKNECKMAKISPNLMKKYYSVHQEAQQYPIRINTKRFTPRHFRAKLIKKKLRENL